MNKCSNTSCPFCGKCNATYCEYYIDKSFNSIFTKDIPLNNEVTFDTNAQSNEVYARFQKPAATQLTLVLSDAHTWEALYANGKLIAEDYALDRNDILTALASIFPNQLTYKWVSDSIIANGMPEDLNELEILKGGYYDKK